MSDAPINVLLACANPLGTSRLLLDSEIRTVLEAIELSQERNHIHVTPYFATTIRDLSRALMKYDYNILHVSGHGTNNGLLLADEQGGIRLVDQHVLAELLEIYQASLQCVILNACYSATQGSLLAQHVPFTIMMDGPLTDTVAIKFSEGFYDALGAGKSIEAAFKQGQLRVKFDLPTARLPVLLKQGETLPLEGPSGVRSQAKDELEYIHLREGKALLGFALDLSGSMETSVLNTKGGAISRLEGVQQALKDLMDMTRKGIRDNRNKNVQTSVDIFAYGFGLRTMPVCDLLSLMKASQEIITQDVTAHYREQVEQEMKSKHGNLQGFSNVLKRFGVDRFLAGVSVRHGQVIVMRRMMHDMMTPLQQRLQEIGDTTLSLEEVAEMWEKHAEVLGGAKELVYGNTPVTEVLDAVTERFEREMQTRDLKTYPMLLLVSDGQFTDVDPFPLVERLRTLGVTIISCFLSRQDETSHRTLFSEPQPHWSNDARQMFDMASILDDESEVYALLLRDGWTLHPQAKLFIQLNQSHMLEEFVHGLLGPLEDPQYVRSLPRGW